MASNIFWADLHNHNEIGVGKGSLQRSYQLASNLLDVYAFMPHGWWPDAPAGDARIADYHLNAFDAVSAAFPRVQEMANHFYRPGEFVAFVGYEWHSSQWGDYHVIFPGTEGSLFRASNVRDLQDFVRSSGAIMVPHHCAYRVGLRGTNWKFWESDVSPVAEGFSEHGNSLEEDPAMPMLNHSMGGSQRSQTILRQLRHGSRMGLTAGTDNHFGHPACYGEGITGILADELTREGILGALRSRHTFAATGDRIELRVSCGDAIMGDCVAADSPPALRIEVDPLGPLEFVQVLKNGEPVHIWQCPPVAQGSHAARSLVRVEWGWGAMARPILTDWQIQIVARDAVVRRAIPCFGGGAGSTELLNTARVADCRVVDVQSFTSRANPRPTNAVVLDLECDAGARLELNAATVSEGAKGGCRIDVTIGDLACDDAQEGISPLFSAPRIRVGKSYDRAALHFEEQWKDPRPEPGDFYMVKAQQTNGQCAWSSPIWLGTE